MAIVYDIGAAVPVDILTSLDGVAESIFVLPDSAYNRRVADQLAGLAEVTDVDGVASRRPDGITTFSDFQLDTTARLARQLGLPFHTETVARDITRKFRQRTILNAAGVGHTATALITDRASAVRALDEVPIPGVLKPNRGVGGTNTYLVETPDQLLRLAADLLGEAPCDPDDGYVLETRLPPGQLDGPWGGYVSVESVVRSGVAEHLGVTGKFALSPPLREHGGFVPPVPGSVERDAVFDLTGRALAALGITDAVCHTEVMLSPAGPEIIEVNGRSGGNIQDIFLRGHGVNLIELAVRVALGERCAIRLRDPENLVFNYFGLAPLGARRIREVPGLDAVRALPEIHRFDLAVPPGTALDWRRGFRERIYVCRGAVSGHDELAAFVPRMERLLGAVYD